MHGVMTFLGSLELARNRKVKLRQAEKFSELWMYRYVENIPVEADTNSGEE